MFRVYRNSLKRIVDVREFEPDENEFEADEKEVDENENEPDEKEFTPNEHAGHEHEGKSPSSSWMLC